MDKEQGFLILQVYIILFSISFYMFTDNAVYLVVGMAVFIGNYFAKDSIERQIKKNEEKEKLLGTTEEDEPKKV